MNYIDSSNVFQAMRQQQETINEFVSVDIEANILSEIDEEGYQEAKLRDADSILHQCLMPMGFPFSEFHPYPYSDVMRTYPKDIDEMPEILAMEDYAYAPFEDGPFGYGKYEVGKSMKSTYPTDFEVGTKAAVRRSFDPGVMEVTIINNDKISNTTDPAVVSRHNDQANEGAKDIAQDDSSPRRSSRKRKSSNGQNVPDSKPSSLMDYYQRFQTTKKSKLSDANSCVQKKLVSVRFASVSSRSTILEDDISNRCVNPSNPDPDPNETATKRVPIVVRALLPLEVQAGRSLNVQTAAENAKKLGSYDMRYGMPAEKTSSSGNRARRSTTGRTRQMWTKAHSGAGTSAESYSSRHRLAYSSLLDGNRIDVALYRRPREVAVTVRLNGVRLSHEQSVAFSPKSVMDRPLGEDGETVVAESGLTDKTISASITAAVGPLSSSKSKKKDKSKNAPQAIDTETPTGQPLCFLQSEDLLQKLLRSRKAKAAWAKRATKTADTPGGEIVPDAPDSTLTDFLHPTLDCLPTTDGLIRVICTSPGDMKPRWVPAILALDLDETKPDLCSVCFGSDATEPVVSCSDCAVRVHLSCCADKGTRPADKDGWLCASCSTNGSGQPQDSAATGGRKRKSKTPSRFRDDEENEPVEENRPNKNPSALQCQLCPHSGGAMSPSVGGAGYVHEVCRIWTDHGAGTNSVSERMQDMSRNPLLNRFRTLCAICGSRTKDMEKTEVDELIRCAASGCQVRFHPMCGLLASKISTSEAQGEMPSDKLGRMKILDVQLCKQYTLTMMKCNTDSEVEKTTIRPVAFCGLHNPIRDTSLYGCLPCGGIVGDAMRIPSVNLP